MLNKTILVKSISSLSEARYCAGMFVDYISFDFNPESEAYVEKKQFEEIKGWLSGVKIIGSLNSEDVFTIIDTISTNKLDGFLFNEDQIGFVGDLTLEVKILEIESSRLIQNLNIDWSIFNLIIIKGDITSEIISNIKASFEGLILLGYDFSNPKKEIEGIDGFAFIGSKEEKPGHNNYDELMDTLEYLDEMDN